MNESIPCPWPAGNPLMECYHDEEWGVPVTNDRTFFEFLTLDAFQAGLSWAIVLNKRQNFREAFDDFDFEKIALYDDNKMALLGQNPGIIRNKLKIRATVENAQAFIRIRKEFGTFSRYIWQFTNFQPIVNKWTTLSEIPASTPVSDQMSKDLKKKGFRFVGSTICYAFMQAAGMINDHLVTCSRYHEINKLNHKEILKLLKA